MFKIFSFLLYSHSFTCISTLPWQLLFQNGASCYGLAKSHKPSLLLHQFFSSNGLLFKTKEGARTFYQMLVPIYQTTHCHIPRVHNFSFLSVVVAIPCALCNLVTSSKSLKNITVNLMSWSSVWLRQSILSCGKPLKFFLQGFVTVCIHVVSHSRLFRI